MYIVWGNKLLPTGVCAYFLGKFSEFHTCHAICLKYICVISSCPQQLRYHIVPVCTLVNAGLHVEGPLVVLHQGVCDAANPLMGATFPRAARVA